MMRMYYYTPVFHRGLKLSVIDGTKLTSLTTPLNNRGLKHDQFPGSSGFCLTTPLNNRGLKLKAMSFSVVGCLTTPLNNRGLKPQDIVYFAVSEGGTPQVIPRSCENARKKSRENTGKRRKPTPKIQRQAVTTCLSGQQKTKPIPRIAFRPEQAWFLCLLKK